MNKEKIKIGIDLDDTVWEFYSVFFDWYNEKYNTNYLFEDFREYNVRDFLGLTEDEMHNVFVDFENDERNRILPEINNVKESLHKLKDSFDLFFVTARPAFYNDSIKMRLKEVFNLDFPVFFQYDENKNKIKDKVEFCQEIGISIMIDDAIHNLIPMVQVGIKCFLLDYPWNRVENLDEKIIRVKGWDEILELLEMENVK